MESTDRYTVDDADKQFGPPNAERRGLNRILVNSGVVAGILVLVALIWIW